jgi:Flp pilus assembly pilin Flp
MIRKIITHEGGATAIEYALICALIVIACVAGFTVLGGGSNGLWTKVNSNVSSKL